MFRSRKLSYSYPSTTGQFNADYADLPLKKLLVNIPVSQTGSGTPAPDNIRDFIGVSGVNIGQISNGQYVSAFKGVLAGKCGFVDLGSLNWEKDSTSYSFTYFKASAISDMKIGWFTNTDLYACENYAIHNWARSSLPNNHIGNFSAGTARPIICDDSKSNLTEEEFKTAMSGVYFVYELAEPSTPVTPQQFATLCQAFGITGNTYTISFGQTVYSAILDVLTGKLYLTHEIKTIDENSLIDMTSIPSVFYLNDFFDIANDAESVNCNCYYKDTNRANPNSVSGSNHDLTFCCRTSAPTLYIKDTRFTSTEDYKTWLSTNPVKIAVKLAEPIEIPLGGIDIKTLQGVNNIFADIGNIETQCIKLGN